MTSGTKIILGMLAAAAVGAAAGILLAPEKGSDLRKKIKSSVDELVEDVSELLALGKDEVKEAYSNVEESVQRGAERVRNSVSESYSNLRHDQN
jgi:gas vesicle protein